jgi:hypothetical protein
MDQNNTNEQDQNYNPRLAQELDQLIQTRYDQMASQGLEIANLLQKSQPETSSENIKLQVLRELSKQEEFDFELLNKSGEPNSFGEDVLRRLPDQEVGVFDKFLGIKFSKQAKKGYQGYQKNGDTTILKKLDRILEDISKSGNLGKFLENVASGNELGFGWHKGKEQYKNCIIFDIGSAIRIVMQMDGKIVYFDDYH